MPNPTAVNPKFLSIALPELFLKVTEKPDPLIFVTSKKSPLAIFCAVIPIEGNEELTPPNVEVPVKNS